VVGSIGRVPGLCNGGTAQASRINKIEIWKGLL
jgi:hypothetical protein